MTGVETFFFRSGFTSLTSPFGKREKIFEKSSFNVLKAFLHSFKSVIKSYLANISSGPGDFTYVQRDP